MEDEAYRDRAYISDSEDSTLASSFVPFRAANDDQSSLTAFTKQTPFEIRILKKRKKGWMDYDYF